MSQQQPQLYSNLTAALSPEEQNVIKAALDQADKIASDHELQLQQQQLAQQQATAAAGGPPTTPGAQTQANGTS